VGGYVTGRRRTKWVGMHKYEVFFRDTANGFLTWATASVMEAALLASAALSVVAGTAHIVADVATGAAAGAGQATAQSATDQAGDSADATAYFVE
jgi:hypothetical protein